MKEKNLIDKGLYEYIVKTVNQPLEKLVLNFSKEKTFHLQTAEYMFFSSVRGIISRIDHMLSHKRSLNKFRKIEIISSIFSYHNVMKLEINYGRKLEKQSNT